MPPNDTEIALLKHRADEAKKEFEVVWEAVEKVRDRINSVEMRVSLIVGIGIALNVLVNVFDIGGK